MKVETTIQEHLTRITLVPENEFEKTIVEDLHNSRDDAYTKEVNTSQYGPSFNKQIEINIEIRPNRK